MLAELERGLAGLRGRKVLAAMSGGVDSALAAVLLRRAGAEVVGVHMRVWHYGGGGCDDLNAKIGTCCSPADANDARRVAEQFDFPFYSLDFEADFRKSVIDPFVGDYLAGRTPNPCVNCNSKLKLGTLLGKARAYGAELVATGHYARIRRAPGGRSELLRAADLSKDQSYYLFDLSQEQLARFATPLGEISKETTRELARELHLPVAEKPDSQDICFVADKDYRRFLREDAGVDPADLGGDIVDAMGRRLGRHGGIHNFTVGQRRGLGVSASSPLYVLDIVAETRQVVVGSAQEALSRGLMARGLNWIGQDPTEAPLRARAKIRHRHDPAPCTLAADGQGGGRIEFDSPVWAATSGQAVVLYDHETGQRVLAGGWIERAIR